MWRMALRSNTPRRLLYHDACDGPSVLFLLRRIDTMSRSIYRKTVHEPLHREVFQLAEMRRIVLLDHGDESARAGCVCSAETRVEFHDIRSLWKRGMSNGLVSIQRENRERVISTA